METGTRIRTIAGLFGALMLGYATLAVGGAVEAATLTVRITDALEPASVTVPRDTTVTFVNDDADRHRVRTTSAPVEFDSGNLDTGQSFTVTLRASGTYHYRDERNTENPAYVGRIVVSDTATTTTVDPTPPPTTAPTAVSVSIGDRVFVPSSVTVAPGGTVTWTNDDDRPHTVTANDRSFDSGIMEPGATWTRTFPNGGTFAYFCELHPAMVGTVQVPTTGGGGAPPPTTTPPVTTVAPTTTAAPTTTVPSGGGTTAPTSAHVAIADNRFTPATVTIVAGGTVTWANDHAVPHTVTATDGGFASGILRQGDGFSRTFPTVGTFEYFCELHPEMTGTVVVVPPGSPTPPTTRPPTRPTTTAPPPTSSPAPTTASPPRGSADLPTSASVAITGNRFAPGTITIAVGGTVSWVNQDAVPHTVTATDRSFDSGIMMQGDRWSRTFSAPGTYTYFCEIHPAMTATVVVTSPGADDPPVVTAGSGGRPSTAATAPTSGAPGGNVAAAAPGSASVGMGDLQFQPVAVTIGAGGSVTWTNTDSLPHTVTADDGSFDSGVLMPGDTYTRTFSTPGTIGYRCTLHPGMNGTVEVLETPAASSGDGANTATDGSVETGGARAAVGSSSPTAPAGDVVVSIEGDEFPAVTTVVAGNAVTWVNNDDVAHNVIANDGTFTSDRFVQPGHRFSHRFTEPGIYPYTCDLHPHMRGIVVVTAADDAGADAPTTTVRVTDTGFEPADIVVHEGDVVRWEFEGVLPHTVTADDGSFDSGILQPGDTFTFTFATVGTFTYTCTLHPLMVGSVTVIPADEPIPDDVPGSAEVGGTSGVVPGGEPPPDEDRPSSMPMLLLGLFAGLALSIVVGIGTVLARSGVGPATAAG